MSSATGNSQNRRRQSRKLLLETLENRRLLAAMRVDDPQGISGDVFDYRTTPNGEFAIYSADAEVEALRELYLTNLQTAQVVKISDPSLHGNVLNFEVSPDSQFAVFRAINNGVPQLYSTSLTDGQVTRLNGDLAPGGRVENPFFEPFSEFLISSDSSRVVYLADQDEDEQFQLYSAAITGGEAPVRLNGELPVGGDVSPGFKLAPDSSRVVYRASQDDPNVVEVFSVPLAGGSNLKLNDQLAPGGNVTFDDRFSGLNTREVIHISPDSQRVIYSADKIDEVFELFSVPIGGGTPTRLNDPVLGWSGPEVQFTSDSTQVVFLAEQTAPLVQELFVAPLAGGGGMVKLSGILVPGGTVMADFQINHDDSKVVYRADQDVDNMIELYWAPLTGGGTTKINGPLQPHEDIATFPDFFSPFKTKRESLAAARFPLTPNPDDPGEPPRNFVLTEDDKVVFSRAGIAGFEPAERRGWLAARCRPNHQHAGESSR